MVFSHRRWWTPVIPLSTVNREGNVKTLWYRRGQVEEIPYDTWSEWKREVEVEEEEPGL